MLSHQETLTVQHAEHLGKIHQLSLCYAARQLAVRGLTQYFSTNVATGDIWFLVHIISS